VTPTQPEEELVAHESSYSCYSNDGVWIQVAPMRCVSGQQQDCLALKQTSDDELPVPVSFDQCSQVHG
jgi:hypothetical protein